MYGIIFVVLAVVSSACKCHVSCAISSQLKVKQMKGNKIKIKMKISDNYCLCVKAPARLSPEWAAGPQQWLDWAALDMNYSSYNPHNNIISIELHTALD